jgi:hypothetical protein
VQPAAAKVEQAKHVAEPPVAHHTVEARQDGRQVNIPPARSNESAVTEPSEVPVPSDQSRPQYYWTWRLLTDGYDVAACLAIRGIDRETLWEHLFQAAQAGCTVRLEWVLSTEQQAFLEKVAGRMAPNRWRSLADELPPGIEPRHVQLYWQIREVRRNDAGAAHP